VPAQCLYEQEAQRGHILTDRGRRQLLGLEPMSLILPNLLGPEQLALTCLTSSDFHEVSRAGQALKGRSPIYSFIKVF
jgi:hypothetical protein